MSYLDDLEQAFATDDLRGIFQLMRRAFAEVAERFRQAKARFDSLDVQIQDVRDRMGVGTDRVTQLEEYVVAVDDRLSKLEIRFQLVDALPVDAPLGTMMRLRVGTQAERIPLYLGNGTGQPLTKLVPTAV